jgi:DNA-binding response OmpR family regulator
MRLLIASLTDGSQHSLSIAMNSERDIADFATGLDDCIKLVRENPYDLALLIVGQHTSSARLLIERVRQAGGELPLVVLGVGGDEPDFADSAETVGGGFGEAAPALLEAPAAEMITASASADPVPRTIEVNAARELVMIDGRPLLLSQTEFHIFALLWRRRGRIVTSEELLSAVYGPQARPTSRVLPVFMFKLRRKLAAAGMEKYIQTAVGRGFIMYNPN